MSQPLHKHPLFPRYMMTLASCTLVVAASALAANEAQISHVPIAAAAAGIALYVGWRAPSNAAAAVRSVGLLALVGAVWAAVAL